MKEYLICLMFWMIFVVVLYALGTAIVKTYESMSCNFLVGYLAYSFLVAIGGIIIQVVNAPWLSFAIYMIVIWISILSFIFYSFIKRKALTKVRLLQYLHEHWLLLLICLFLVFLLFFYYRAFWYGNHLDDGYYITKVATMPYNATGFRTNYSVGVEKAGVDSYIFNTWELEASFYVKMLGVNVTLFLRLFQSAFYYFVFLNCIKIFAEKIFKTINMEIEQCEIQFVLVITLLFGAYYLFLEDTKLFFVRDMFQFNTGMFLGSGIAKVAGIIMLVMFFVDSCGISIRMFLEVIAIGIVLLSKSSCALPVIFLCGIAYVGASLLYDYGEKGKKWLIVLVGIYCLLSVIIPNGVSRQKETYQYLFLFIKSPIVIIALIVFVLSFKLKNIYINRINCMMIIMALLMIVPQINDLFEMVSVYAFVSGRAWCTFAYTFVILNAVYLYLFLRRLFNKKIYVQVIFGVMGGMLAYMCIYSFAAYGGELFLDENPPVKADIRNSLDTMIGNHYFIPNSTIELGDELENLTKQEKEKLYVVSPEGSALDGTLHTLAVSLRTYAPDVVSVSAVGRYSVDDGSGLKGYKQEFYDAFVVNPNNVTKEKFEKEILEYGINCVVLSNAECEEYMKQMGFNLYSIVGERIYYVWYKARS